MSPTSKCALCMLLATPLLAAWMAAGCSGDVQIGPTGGHSSEDGGMSSSSSASSGGAGGAGGSEEDAGPDAGDAGDAGDDVIDGGMFFPAYCGSQLYMCGNTVDDDGDGLIDWQDPDCLGPCDNSEDGLGIPIVGDAPNGCTTDCFWDENSGSGNDGCYWNHKCDPLSVPPNYFPEFWMGSKCAYDPATNTPGTILTCDELSNQQSAECLGYCPQLTPNGCDCFGCCYVYKDGVEIGPVYLNTEDANGNLPCTFDNAGDPSKCAPCTQVKNGCNNPCEMCELCIGKTTLPPECQSSPMDGGIDAGTDGGNDAGQCPEGVQPCGLPGNDPCPPDYYCITGCCLLPVK
jgi:hypothetical protein